MDKICLFLNQDTTGMELTMDSFGHHSKDLVAPTNLTRCMSLTAGDTVSFQVHAEAAASRADHIETLIDILTGSYTTCLPGILYKGSAINLSPNPC